MKLKTFSSSDVVGKNVLVRVDFNVPQDKSGAVLDVTRLRVHLETIRDLQKAGAKVALVSHLGRPKGKVDPRYTLLPVVSELAKLLDSPVAFLSTAVGEEVRAKLGQMSAGDVVLMENIRYHAEEEANDPEFAKLLAAPFDLFIMDAFSAAHRAHASTRGVADYLPSYAGKSLCREVEMLDAVRDHPKKPFYLILGGAKVSDKIGVIENMLNEVDGIIIGGGMAFTFLKARGYEIGKSLCENEKLDFAAQMMREAEKKGIRILLPVDVLACHEISNAEKGELVSVDAIPVDTLGVDIGPKSEAIFSAALKEAKTVLWNGPMGVFEMDSFASGTRCIADTLAEITRNGSLTVVGGGDSAAAMTKFKMQDQVSHVSTGGGASLEFFEGKVLPGIEPFVI